MLPVISVPDDLGREDIRKATPSQQEIELLKSVNDGTLTIAFSTAESAQKLTETGRGKTTVHITNISRTLSREDLRRAFFVVGEIESLKLMVKQRSPSETVCPTASRSVQG